MITQRWPQSFRIIVTHLVLLCFLRVTLAADLSLKSLSPLEEKIGQAKILYYDFHFKESETLLKDVISSLQALSPSPFIHHDLSEAYLHLALTQDAQNKSKEVNHSLFQAVSYEPNRELDPLIYSPSIVGQFNKAKQRWAKEQSENLPGLKVGSGASSSIKTESFSSQKKYEKKPFYKTWPFFLLLGLAVAGGAAGAAVALGGGGGGGGSGGSGPVTVGGTPQ